MQSGVSVADIKKRARWYVGVRWFYVLAIAAPGILALQLSGGYNSQVAQDLAIVGSILVINALFLSGTYIRSANRNFFELLVSTQVIFDLIVMSAAFYLNAGVETPIAMLYAIPIIMTAAFFSRIEIYMTGLAACVAFASLALLDHFEILRSLNITAPVLHLAPQNFYPTLVTTLAMLIAITVITTLVGSLIREREELTQEMKALTERHAETEAILQALGSALVSISSSGTITMVNHSFEELTGWTRKAVLGRPIDDVLPMLDGHGHRMQAAHRAMLEFMQDNNLVRQLGRRTLSGFSYVRKDGSTFPFVGNVSPILQGAKVVGFTTVFDDATETEKLEQLKDNFIALVSHQLKTPIGEINGFAYNLLGGVAGKLTAKQNEYVTNIQELAARAGKLIADLLDIVLVGGSGLNVMNKPTDLGAVIDVVVDLNKDHAKKKGIKLHKKLPQGLVYIRGDNKKLIQALGNLVDNAITHSLKGTIMLSVVVGDDVVEIYVSDEGEGMDEATKRALFGEGTVSGPLNRAPTAEGGTGLGVYLAKQLVGLMHGTIHLVTSSKRGTTICVTLKRVKP